MRSSQLLVVLICWSGITRSESIHAGNKPPQDLSPVIEPIRQKFNAPAVSAAAVRGGQLIAIGVSGVRDLQKKEIAAIGDRSLIDSCGKAATRLLIGRLVDKGKLRWDSTLAELLPDVTMRDEYKSVTVGDIIGHRAGLQPYTMINPSKTPILFDQTGSPRDQRANFVAHLLLEEPAAQPRTRIVYSNAGYGLLGHIAERLAEKPFEKLMREEVFGPLGMESAIVAKPSDATNLSGWTGHLKIKDGYDPAPPRRGLPAIAPAGNMSMSIGDFAKLAAALVDVESRKPTAFLGAAAVEKPPELRPGSQGEGEIFFGGDGHYTAAFALWPSKQMGIVVETNAGSSDDLGTELVRAVRAAVDPGAESSQSDQTYQQRGRYGFQIIVEPETEDLSIVGIDPGSPADKAGLKKGDTVVAINGTPLGKISSDDRMAQFKKSPLKLRVDRDGSLVEISMELP